MVSQSDPLLTHQIQFHIGDNENAPPENYTNQQAALAMFICSSQTKHNEREISTPNCILVEHIAFLVTNTSSKFWI